LWLDLPYLLPGDAVEMLGSWSSGEPDPTGWEQADAEYFRFVAGGPATDYARGGWCFVYVAQNLSDTLLSYGPLDVSLLTPSGALLGYEVFTELEFPNSGQLSPGGSDGSFVCFDAQSEGGRYALVYSPFLIGVDRRAVLLFDR
jgi:hypothetical protein